MTSTEDDYYLELQAALALYAQQLRDHTLRQWNHARAEALQKDRDKKEQSSTKRATSPHASSATPSPTPTSPNASANASAIPNIPKTPTRLMA